MGLPTWRHSHWSSHLETFSLGLTPGDILICLIFLNILTSASHLEATSPVSPFLEMSEYRSQNNFPTAAVKKILFQCFLLLWKVVAVLGFFFLRYSPTNMSSYSKTSSLRCFPTEFFLYIFWRSSEGWPLLCLFRPFCIFQRCLNSNPESCRIASRRATNLASHPYP